MALIRNVVLYHIHAHEYGEIPISKDENDDSAQFGCSKVLRWSKVGGP